MITAGKVPHLTGALVVVSDGRGRWECCAVELCTTVPEQLRQRLLVGILDLLILLAGWGPCR